MDAPAAPVRSRGARWAPRRSHRVVALDDASLVMVGGFASGAGGGSSAEVWTAARDDDDAWFWRLAVARAVYDAGQAAGEQIEHAAKRHQQKGRRQRGLKHLKHRGGAGALAQ